MARMAPHCPGLVWAAFHLPPDYWARVGQLAESRCEVFVGAQWKAQKDDATQRALTMVQGAELHVGQGQVVAVERSGEAAPRVLCSVLGPSLQEGHRGA